MRCFAAIELNQHCREALKRATEELRELCGEHKWVAPENMHLTIKFIGNVNRKTLPNIHRGLRSACEDICTFTMKVEGLGAFPPKGRPKVIFASVKEDSGTLESLAERIETELAERAGIKKERRRFVPHITLGRTRRGKKCPSPGKLSAELENTDFGAVEVNDVVLMQSELAHSGPRYTVLERLYLA